MVGTSFKHWWPCDCPPTPRTIVHLEVALAARRLALQEFVDLHIHMYEQIMYIGIYRASEDAMTLAFFSQLEALDALAEKHLNLATQAAAP